MKQERYAVVDLEATNDDKAGQKHIIQIGMTFIDNGVILNQLTIDVKPPVRITPAITKLTGITNEQVKKAPMFEDIADYLVSLLDGYIFIAHNVNFDYSLLQEEFQRVGIFNFEMPHFDTFELAKLLLPQQQTLGLASLAKQFDLPLTKHHHAGEDAFVTAQLLLQLFQLIDQLSIETRQICHHLLQQKCDKYALFFEGDHPLSSSLRDEATEQLTDELKRGDLLQTIQTIEQRVMANSVNFVCEKDTGEISACTVEEQGVWFDLEPSSAVSLYFNNEQPQALRCVHVISTAMATTRMALQQDVLMDASSFVHFEKLAFWSQSVRQLTIQDVRQLCRVYIFLETQHHTNIRVLKLPQKLHQQLTTKNGAHATYQQYVRYYFETHRDIYMTVDTLMAILPFVSLKQYVVNLYHLEMLQNELFSATSYQVNLTYLKQFVFQIKSDFQNDVNLQQHVKVLTRIVGQLYAIDSTLKKQYPQIVLSSNALKKDEWANVYLDRLTVRSKRVYQRLLYTLQRLHSVLQAAFDRRMFDVFSWLQPLEKLLTTEYTGHFNYIQLHADDKLCHMQLCCVPFHHRDWVNTLKQACCRVCVSEAVQESSAMVSYMQQQLGAVVVETTNDDLPQTITVLPKSVEPSLKENLFIKKVLKLGAMQTQRTIIIVPSLPVLTKLKEQNENAHILETNATEKMWANIEATGNVVYMTYQQFCTVMLPPTIERIICLKLPFDAPGNVYEQANRYFNDYGNYFSSVQLPKVVLRLEEIVHKKHEQTEMIICDNRLVNSRYSEQILTMWGKSVRILSEC